MSNLIVCTFNKGYARCDTAKCWNCESNRAVAHMTTNPYLGDIFTCVDCGDKWSDGEAWGRPFRPRWRKESIAEATAIWDAPDTMTWAEACAKQDELFRDYFKDGDQ